MQLVSDTACARFRCRTDYLATYLDLLVSLIGARGGLVMVYMTRACQSSAPGTVRLWRVCSVTVTCDHDCPPCRVACRAGVYPTTSPGEFRDFEYTRFTAWENIFLTYDSRKYANGFLVRTFRSSAKWITWR